VSKEAGLDGGELKVLVDAAKRGDEGGFRTLVESLSRTLMAMAYRYTGDWEWARDLTQETWLRVHRNFHRFDLSRSFTAWLFSIHRNGCRDHLRRPWVTRERTPGGAVVEELAGAAGERTDEALEEREFRERILAACAGLSESQREVFLRVDVEQGDQQEVARALGIRFGTLRTTLHFARKRVAAALTEMEAGT
jgi:RNA polymerase sigma-70 factor (ECF subfamily)